MLTILFDGVAYGMLLFVLACGLSVTLGLMNFINLAHGAFAMAGGYCTVILVNSLGVPFALGLPLLHRGIVGTRLGTKFVEDVLPSLLRRLLAVGKTRFLEATHRGSLAAFVIDCETGKSVRRFISEPRPKYQRPTDVTEQGRYEWISGPQSC